MAITSFNTDSTAGPCPHRYPRNGAEKAVSLTNNAVCSATAADTLAIPTLKQVALPPNPSPVILARQGHLAPLLPVLPAAAPAPCACKGIIEGRVVLPLLCSQLSPRAAASRAAASSPRLAAALPPTAVAPVCPLPPGLLLVVVLVVLPPTAPAAPAATRPS